MAKDSDKRRVLTRRKQELDHAIRHSYSMEAVTLRAEKLRAAALAVLKKYRSRGGLAGEESLQARWEGLSVEEIVELTVGWGPQPTLRDIRLRDRD
jgi:hypothetical protein